MRERICAPSHHHYPFLAQPYFGLGANSALEDVVELGKQVKSHGLSAEAASSFNKERGGEAKALVKLSRGFDRPGALGFASFILPLILDGIFHGEKKRGRSAFATPSIRKAIALPCAMLLLTL